MLILKIERFELTKRAQIVPKLDQVFACNLLT